MFFSMFFNTNVEILMNDGIVAMTRVYILFSVFVMFWVDPNINICERVKKNHLSLYTCFVYLHVEHVAPMYILLHCNYPKIEKIKKGQLKFELKLQGANVLGKYPKPFI
jgi:hypothetical protein